LLTHRAARQNEGNMDENHLNKEGGGSHGAALLLLPILLCLAGTAAAQTTPGDPGQSRNLIGLTPDPDDIRDTKARQQNEPSCAIRPGNSACIICGYNDYRTVDLFGDGWQGVSMSCDGGNNWLSRIAPGHPDHIAPIGAEFAADPRMVAAPGIAIFNFIAGNRIDSRGVVAVQHWLEVNKEDADFYEPGLNTTIVDEGSDGRFLDKPDMLLVLDPPDKQTLIPLSIEMENSDLGDQGTIHGQYPSGILYVAYAVFTGSQSVKVLLKVSKDLGLTWRNKSFKLSEDQNLVSGISLTAIGDTVLATWRRAGDNNDFDSIMYSFITQQGKKATKGEVLANICSFDQVSNASPFQVTFRTNDFPWAASDGKNFYVFYSDRDFGGNGNCLNGRPRIVMNYAGAANKTWQLSPIPLDDAAVYNGSPSPRSFQFMPSAMGARGKIQIAWYDTRREGVLPPDIIDFSADPTDPSVVGDYVSSVGNIHRKVDVFSTRVTSDEDGIVQAIPAPVRVSQYRIAAEIENGVLGGKVALEAEASFSGKKLYASGSLPFLGDYISVAGQQFRLREDGLWESNSSPIESPALDKTDFFVAWTDNRDVRGNIMMLEDSMPYSPPDTDLPQMTRVESRDDLDEEPEVLLAEAEVPDLGPPADRTKTAEGLDGSDLSTAACDADAGAFDRSRDANIYGAVIQDRFRMFAPTPTKPLTGLQRAIVIAMANTESVERKFRLEIVGQPEPCALPELCRASFRQQPSVPPFNVPIPPAEDPVPPRVTEEVTVPPQSALARTVFIVADSEIAEVTVHAFDTDCDTYPNCATPIASIVLGGAPDMQNPDFFSESCLLGSTDPGCDVLRAEFHNPALINPALINPALINPNLINPNLINPNLINPNLINPNLINYYLQNPNLINPFLINPALINYILENPNLINSYLTNPNLINPNLINPNLINPNLINPNLINPNLINPNLINSTLTDGSGDFEPDLTWTDYNYVVQNTGNVTTAYDADVTLEVPDGVAVDTQLIAWAPSFTTTSLNCEERLQIEANVFATVNNPDASLDTASIDSPFAGEISGLAKAGETLIFTLRVFGTPTELAAISVSGFTAASQAANCSQDVPSGNTDDWFCETSLAAQRELILLDTLPPVLDLSDDIVANAVGIDGAIVNYMVTATDSGDSNPAVSCLPASGSMFPLGATTVNCTATDNIGNSSSGSFTVTVVDNTPPTISAPGPVSVEATAALTPAADVSLGAATADDTFGGVSVSNNAPAEYSLGPTTVIWKATDDAGNTATDDQIVTITDNTAPDISLNGNNPEPHEAGDTYTDAGASAFDIVDGMAVTLTLSGDVVDSSTVPNPYTITWTATDNDGNYASIDRTVVVEDTTLPSITAPDNVSKEATLVLTPLTAAELGTPTASDSFSTVSVSNDGLAGYPVGDTVVTWTATDVAGNMATAQQTVTITDTTPPEFNVMDDTEFNFEATTPAGAVVDLTGALTDLTGDGLVTATDKGESLDVTCITSTGVTLPATLLAGIYSVTCSTTDGFISFPIEVTVKVDVEDLVAPVLSVPGTPVTADADPMTGTAIVDFSGLVSATDNVDENLTLTCSPLSGSAFNVGLTSVTCIAIDDGPNASGGTNSDTDTFTVDVSDITAPVVMLNGPPLVTLEASDDPYADAGAFAVDSAEGAIVPLPSGAVNTVVPGTYLITWTATDSSGNIGSVQRTVTVVDTTAPVITSPTPEEFEATASLTPATDVVLTEPTATDVVGVDSLTNDAPGFYPLGDTIVTWTATDAAGNSSSATQAVTLEDTVAPSISAANDQVLVDSLVSPVAVDFSANLSVEDIVDTEITPDCIPVSGSEFSWGTTSVSCSATDASGNTSTNVSFDVVIQYLYEVNFILPKGSPKAGRTLPIDWQYLDRLSLQPVDSSTFEVGIAWQQYPNNDCSGDPIGIAGSDTDSGFSDFRYSHSTDTWQYSFQTPDEKGHYLIEISPPGARVEIDTDSTECITLR